MTSNLRVLFVPHAYAPVRGGTELLCQRVAEELVALGHQVTVLTTDAGAVQAYYQFGVPAVRHAPAAINGVAIVRVPLGGSLFHRLEPVLQWIPPGNVRTRVEGRAWHLVRWRLMRAFRRHIEAMAPDVVVTMPHLVVNVEAVLKIHRRRPFPLVILPMLHEHDPTWEAEPMRAALTQADAVVAMTTHERERLTDVYGVAPDAVVVGGMGVDVPASPARDPQRRDTVLFLGRKSVRKGIPLLIDAMTQVWQQRPDVPLVMAGASTEDRDAIDARIRALPSAFRRNVVSEDNITDERKDELLRHAACLVLPSPIESFGGVILEAWARATPTVALDLPVFREILTPGVTGLLAPTDDAAGMAASINWMLEHPEAARAMGTAGLARASSDHSWRAVTLRHLTAYEHAVRVFGAR